MSTDAPSHDVIESEYSSAEGRFIVSTRDIIHQYGKAIHFILYSSLLIPSFIEVEGSVLLQDNGDDLKSRFISARKDSKMTLSELEESFNSLEIVYLFPRDDFLDENTEIIISEIMASAWSGALIKNYPERTFKVSIYTAEETGSVVSIGFCEIRN